MRKILLGTTAVAGAALLGATSAQAQTAPTVRIGGYFEFNVGYVADTMDKVGLRPPTAPGFTTNSPSQVNANYPRRDRWDFRQGDTEIHLFVTGKAANGLTYGATLEIQMDNATTTGSGTVFDTDEAWGFVASPTLGQLRFGDEDSAASLMQTRLPQIVGTGPDNMWDEYVARSPDGQAPYLVSGINDGSDATKIIYLSPQFYGFDFGVSFAPNGREGEAFNSVAGATILQRDPNDSNRNEWSAALRYRGSFGNVGVATTFGAQWAEPGQVIGTVNAANPNLQNITAYHVGLNVSYMGFTIGGEYAWGKYGGASTARTAIRSGLDSSSHWAIGATYETGPWAFGAFYGIGNRDNGTNALGVGLADREQTVWGLGVAYTLAPGLILVTNYQSISDKNLANSPSNPQNIQLAKRDIDFWTAGVRIAF
jgi:predicted porin